jgi:hypothetical protein
VPQSKDGLEGKEKHLADKRAARIAKTTFSPSFMVLTAPQGSSVTIPSGRVNIKEIKSSVAGNFLKSGEHQKASNTKQYIYIYASSISDITMNGIPSEDFPRGIYHLNIGSDEGLLKKVTFNRVDQAYLKERNFEREGSLGIGQLRERYNVDMDFFGNTLWHPGSMVFLNPSIAGMGNPAKSGSLASKLGLGGYYLINKISNSIDENGFSTDVQGIWTGPGTNPPDDVSAVASSTADTGLGGVLSSVTDIFK